MFKQKFYLVVLAIYQLFSALMIGIGVWPAKAVLASLFLQLLAILFFDDEYALYSVVLAIPFYLVVPNGTSDTLSAWRIAFLFLFLVYVYRNRPKGEIFTKIRFFSWDRAFVWFLVAAVLSLLVAADRTAGIKKIVFILNIYFIYILVLNIIRSKEQLVRLITVSFASLASIVLLGFVQFFSTYATSTYYFWQYWALFISRAYYGLALSNTLTYSNSWFSFIPGQPAALRMFSILPDSHAFAVVAMFSIPFAATLIYFAKKKYQRVLLWFYIVLAALAITLSGTRGVWATVLVPVLLLIFLYVRKIGTKLLRPMSVPLIIFLALLVITPLAQKLSRFGNHDYGNFLERAESITSLNEPSNAGRIRIWKQTLKFWVAHPILGAGFGNFSLSLSAADSKAYNLPLRYITAHDIYLDILAESGIIGFIFFANYIFGILKRFWKFFVGHYLFSEDGYVFFVINSGLYFVWLFAYLFFDGTLLNDRVLMYFFIILATSARIMLLEESQVVNQAAESEGIKKLMPKLSINLLAWNHDPDLVVGCIEAVLSSDYEDYELTFSDNGSSNGLLQFISKKFSNPKFRVQDNKINLGYAGGQNKFIASCDSELVMVLNPDALLKKDFLGEIVSAFDDHNVAAATGKMLKPKVDQGRPQIIDGTGIMLKPSRKAFERGQLQIDAGQFDDQTDIFGVSGTAAVYRRSALEQVALDQEYFDQDFFAYWEDLDLSWRLRLAGFKCLYVPKAVVFHQRLVGSSGVSIFNLPAIIKHRRSFSANVIRWNWRNHLFTIIKNDFGLTFWKDFPFIIAREAAMLLYFLIFDWRALAAVPDFFRLLPKILIKRQFIQSHKKVSAAQIDKAISR